MSNTLLYFKFKRGIKIRPGTRKAEFEYLDRGGTVNVSANNGNLYVGNMLAMPASIVVNGVTITKINPIPILNAQGTKVGEKGTLNFKSPSDITTIIIGGQELYLDNFCFN